MNKNEIKQIYGNICLNLLKSLSSIYFQGMKVIVLFDKGCMSYIYIYIYIYIYMLYICCLDEKSNGVWLCNGGSLVNILKVNFGWITLLIHIFV